MIRYIKAAFRKIRLMNKLINMASKAWTNGEHDLANNLLDRYERVSKI